jgi:hypothetical protein
MTTLPNRRLLELVYHHIQTLRPSSAQSETSHATQPASDITVLSDHVDSLRRSILNSFLEHGMLMCTLDVAMAESWNRYETMPDHIIPDTIDEDDRKLRQTRGRIAKLIKTLEDAQKVLEEIGDHAADMMSQ